jgi:hypothetical protein
VAINLVARLPCVVALLGVASPVALAAAPGLAHAASPRCLWRRPAHLLVPVAGRPGFRRSRFEALRRCEMVPGNPVRSLSRISTESPTGGLLDLVGISGVLVVVIAAALDAFTAAASFWLYGHRSRPVLPWYPRHDWHRASFAGIAGLGRCGVCTIQFSTGFACVQKGASEDVIVALGVGQSARASAS